MIIRWTPIVGMAVALGLAIYANHQTSRWIEVAEQWHRNSDSFEEIAEGATKQVQAWQLMCTQREKIMGEVLAKATNEYKVCASMLPKDQRDSLQGLKP